MGNLESCKKVVRANISVTIRQEKLMGRYLLLWVLGVPIPLLVLIWAFGGFH
jgi:hypothetical protein